MFGAGKIIRAWPLFCFSVNRVEDKMFSVVISKMVGKRAGRNVPKLENRAARLPTLPGWVNFSSVGILFIYFELPNNLERL